MRFDINEIMDQEVIVEFHDGEALKGVYVGDAGDFLVVRGANNVPFLFNPRYVKSIYPVPDKEEE